ncbi:tRNA 2-thiocytidine(32) synthetase TtcA [Nannocystis punicea]|uniref:tRNA 2-thiocytidine(32) synthetase TtcA n=1 Tax=Nannocystis punicea TaxID=2995304 RepID=A0ABY7GZA8_9BACT|nr:tRNA 2-thiocytidine(32) synthetase TtcA [Nannocystis poenicansa]WAS92124.1 tRNA 2-thiocytidine(32) synthetase TtcA [Nannocystis poenicansa]
MASLQQTLLRQISRANRRFGLLEDGDKIMVAISGGKDSWAMLHLLREYRRMVPFSFTWVAVNLDQGHPGFPVEVLREYLEREGHEHRIVHVDTYSVVKREVPAGKAYCSLCSRLRRGILYDVAVELGCTKIALGHHRDDLIETLLLNQLYAGQLKAMAPRLRSDDGRNTIIRPLILCEERDVAAYAIEQGFPVVPCDLCGSQDNLRRAHVRQLLVQLEANNPDVRRSLLAAAGNVKPSHLLDARLQGEGDDDGEAAGAGDGALLSPQMLVRA